MEKFLKKRIGLLATLILVAGLLTLVYTAHLAMATVSDTQDATCEVEAKADAITAPADASLTVTRGSTTNNEGSPGTLTYTTESSTLDITVSASGTGVDGAKLSIKGGNLTTYTELITGNSPVGVNPTLKTNVLAADPGTITPITLELDATGVLAGAAGIGTPWVYEVTYTMQ